LLIAAGSSAATLGVPNSPGVTTGTAKDTIICEYNDTTGLERVFGEHGPRIAGVIFEPVVGNMGCVVPTSEFLRALRELTHRHGALLICDEVMTGFRVAYGGAQALFNIQPDITTLGKIVGGGMPIGAYGGRREIMQHVLPAGKVFQAGTLSGNPVATAAGIGTLQELRDNPPYGRLEAISSRLERGLAAAADKVGIPHAISRVGSMLTLFFNSQPPTGWDSASQSDSASYAKYFWGLLDRGVYMPCSQYEALFVSAAHSEADIDATVAAAAEVFRAL
jgi:glutamate-1-semialdehyde 2,1-aminomutase